MLNKWLCYIAEYRLHGEPTLTIFGYSRCCSTENRILNLALCFFHFFKKFFRSPCVKGDSSAIGIFNSCSVIFDPL